MSAVSAPLRRTLGVVLTLALAVTILPGLFGASAVAVNRGPTASGARSVMTTSGEAADKTLASSLRAAAQTGGTKYLDVLAIVKKGAGKPPTLEKALRLAAKGDPANEYWAGKVRADRITKLAATRGVVRVEDNGRKEPPVLPDVKKRTAAQIKAAQATMRSRISAGLKAGVDSTFAKSVNARIDAGIPSAPTASPGAPAGWFDVGPGHGSSAAWANGFTGSGVKVAVADDGMDFGHPDLQGTQAYVTDPSSPYVGWPMAFDPLSTYLYAFDRSFGTDYTGAGAGWFSSTVATLTGSSASWQGDTYQLPGTSLSGVYHIGRLWDENLQAIFHAYPALLVVDENTAGVYDTVYVDLNGDGDFRNDKKCTKSDPISYLDDWNSVLGIPGSDGYADLSGGMVYWVADGTNHPPFADQEFPSLAGATPPGSGDLVCMMGAYDWQSGHGTLCGSNVAGQGRIDGPSIFGEYPGFKPAGTGTSGGMVQGAGKDAKIVGIADVYYNFTVSTLMAYDFVAFGLDGASDTGDEIQVMSNSYGESGTDNDEWDFPSRYVTLLNTVFAPHSTFLFSTGNGGPGYGTNAPPSPSTGIGVGASTQMGAAGGWDSIDTIEQVTYGDVIPFSNRGPTAMGHVGPTVVADGAYSAGATVLSLSNLDGWTAWEIWGGTSRSCPVAAGNTALVYQAFNDANGRWPTYEEARALLANGATDLNYDTLVQGAGSVNADRATRLAAGLDDGGVRVTPDAWSPGGYRGLKAPAFQQVMHPGDRDTTTLTVTNPGASPVDVTVTDSWMQRTGGTTYDITLDPARMSPYDFNRPDYLLDLTPVIPEGTELMVVRTVVPLSEIDTDGDYMPDNRYRLLTYDWTDRDTDGALWTDSNENGFVNSGEIDPNEYMRFTYSNAIGTSLENRVQMPLTRSHDGIYLGLQQQYRSGIPLHVKVEVSFWNRRDMPWLRESASSFSLAGGESREVPVSVAVPYTQLGTYEGQYRVSTGSTVTVVPVTISVAGNGSNISYGGPQAYEQLMDQGKVFGYTDWAWRPEAGDWRFFSTDVPDSEVLDDGSLWLAHTTWDAAPTDIDTLMYGPVAPAFSFPEVFGPYDLGQTGGSPNTNVTSGVWLFDTATGGAEDWVTGSLTNGLNTVMLHNVLYDGAKVGASFSGETGRLQADPRSAYIEDTAIDHSVDFNFNSSLDLPGFEARVFGLSRPYEAVNSVADLGTWIREFDVADAGYIEAMTLCDTADIDLYLERQVGPSTWAFVGASESGSGNEYVKALLPVNGRYRIRVYGYSVPSGTVDFLTRLSVPQGTDIALSGLPSGAVSGGTTVTLTAAFSKDRTALDARDGSWDGVLIAGPSGAASALEIPIRLTYPFDVESVTPTENASRAATDQPVTAVFTKRLETATVNADTFYLKSADTTIPGTIEYDPATATVRLTAALSEDTTYTAFLTSDIVAADGSVWAGKEWTFHTRPIKERNPTAIDLTVPAGWVKYGTTVVGTVRSTMSVGDGTMPDAGAPVAIMFRPESGSEWTTYTVGVTDLLGRMYPAIGGTAAGSFKAVRLQDLNGLASESGEVGLRMMFNPNLNPRALSVRRGRSIRVDLTVDPTAASKSRTVSIQRWTGRRWLTYRYVGLSKAGTVTFYESRSTRGTKRIRAVIGPWAGYGGAASKAVTLTWR